MLFFKQINITHILVVHFEEIEFHLINELKLAKSRLLIAVAWISNPQIINTIIDLKKTEIDIEIIVDDNDINRKNLSYLIQHGININFVKNLIGPNSIMHNKFCVIDSFKVITGSYNWTMNANSNDENIVIIKDSDTASFYSHEFRRINLIENSNDKLSFDKKDTDEIIALLISEFKEIIRKNLVNGKLVPKSIANYESIKIKNRIRTLSEEVTNNEKSRAGSLGKYFDLFMKYGMFLNSLASEEEKAKARHSFSKDGLTNYDFKVNKLFKKFKHRAIHELVRKYADLFKKNMNEDEVNKILLVYQFLILEKNQLGKELGIIIN